MFLPFVLFAEVVRHWQHAMTSQYWPQTVLASTSSCRCCRSSPTVYCRSSACLVSKSGHISSRWPNGLDGVERSVAGKLFLDIQQESRRTQLWRISSSLIYSFNLHLQLQHVGWSLLVHLSGEKNPQISEYIFLPNLTWRIVPKDVQLKSHNISRISSHVSKGTRNAMTIEQFQRKERRRDGWCQGSLWHHYGLMSLPVCFCTQFNFVVCDRGLAFVPL